MTEKEIYLRAYNDLKHEWEKIVQLVHRNPSSESLPKMEMQLFDKMEKMKILMYRKGYLREN